jgi:hypothetical protein
MQHLNNQLKVAFFIMLCYWALPVSVYAQDVQKAKFIQVRKIERLKKHKGDKLVTLTLPESVARELLAALLDEYNPDAVYPIHKKAIPVDPSLSLEGSKQVIRSIIAEMTRDSIVKDRGSFTWFALDGRQFVVDGKAVPDSLRTRFQSEYIKVDGWGYYFGPVEVKGKGIFLDRGDVY